MKYTQLLILATFMFILGSFVGRQMVEPKTTQQDCEIACFEECQ